MARSPTRNAFVFTVTVAIAAPSLPQLAGPGAADYNADMPRKAAVQLRCALCGAKDVSEPRGEEKYCRDCWDKKIAVEEIVAREFALKRYIRAHSAERYLIYHSTIKRPCGQIIVVDDGYDLFLTLILYPTFAWDEPAYHLDGDPEGRTFAEILVDVIAAEVIEPWGGGKWHLEIFRSTHAGARGLERGNVRLLAAGFRLGSGSASGFGRQPSGPPLRSVWRGCRHTAASTTRRDTPCKGTCPDNDAGDPEDLRDHHQHAECDGRQNTGEKLAVQQHDAGGHNPPMPTTACAA